MNTSATSSKPPIERRTPDYTYVLVTGGREYKRIDVMRKAMRDAIEMQGPCIFINGMAEGADTLCIVLCKENEWPVYCYPAQWSKYGRGKGNPAGPIRNKHMLEMHPNVKLVLAFHDFLPHSKGTYDMCKLALAANIPVLHYTDDGFFAVYTKSEELPPKKE